MNSQNILQSLQLLQQVVHNRLESHFKKQEREFSSIFPPVQIPQDHTPLHDFIIRNKLTIEEYIVLLIALVPHVQPTFFENVIQEFLPQGGDFAEFGGVKGTNQRTILPTGETALFIVAGNEMPHRLQMQQMFGADHFFAKENILLIESVKEGEPRMSGKIILQHEYVDLFTTGSVTRPGFGPDFPAKLVTTKMDWDDLVLNPKTAQPISDIKIWLHHNTTFMNEWGMEKKIKPGFRALFYGPPGTGKTLTATLLGKQFQKDVYRVDLSQVVSKYIGETEKNLEKIFTKAENKNWILFFDEADALFGKRSNVQNAHDKYANQEVSYLLQRVEDFPGLIILASNFKSNLDSAFIRRFNSIIYFPMPDHEERYRLWKNTIPAKAGLGEDVDLLAIARRYELSGSAIVSVIHYASLQTIYKECTIITKADIIEGIKREYEKEEKVFVG
jgi:hypothetical protein